MKRTALNGIKSFILKRRRFCPPSSVETEPEKSTMFKCGRRKTWFVDEGKITIDDIDVNKAPGAQACEVISGTCIPGSDDRKRLPTMQIEEKHGISSEKRNDTFSEGRKSTAKEREFYREQLKNLRPWS